MNAPWPGYSRERDLAQLIPYIAPAYRMRPKDSSRSCLAVTHVIIHRLAERRQFIALHGGDTRQIDHAIACEKQTADHQIDTIIGAAAA